MTTSNIRQVLEQLLRMFLYVLAHLTNDCTAVRDCVIYLFHVFEVIGLRCTDLYTFYTNFRYHHCMLQTVYTVPRAACI